MKVLLDTNVLLRLDDTAHRQHPAALAAVEQLLASGHEPLLVPQVVYEFWVVATRPLDVNGLGLTTKKTAEILADWLGMFRLLLDERGVFGNWQQLVVRHDVKGKQAHDARLVAAMDRHGVTQLMTFNTADFERFSHITPLSPVSVAAGELPT